LMYTNEEKKKDDQKWVYKESKTIL
jgi:hypothetical protein